MREKVLRLLTPHLPLMAVLAGLLTLPTLIEAWDVDIYLRTWSSHWTVAPPRTFPISSRWTLPATVTVLAAMTVLVPYVCQRWGVWHLWAASALGVAACVVAQRFVGVVWFSFDRTVAPFGAVVRNSGWGFTLEPLGIGLPLVTSAVVVSLSRLRKRPRVQVAVAFGIAVVALFEWAVQPWVS